MLRLQITPTYQMNQNIPHRSNSWERYCHSQIQTNISHYTWMFELMTYQKIYNWIIFPMIPISSKYDIGAKSYAYFTPACQPGNSVVTFCDDLSQAWRLVTKCHQLKAESHKIQPFVAIFFHSLSQVWRLVTKFVNLKTKIIKSTLFVTTIRDGLSRHWRLVMDVVNYFF